MSSCFHSASSVPTDLSPQKPSLDLASPINTGKCGPVPIGPGHPAVLPACLPLSHNQPATTPHPPPHLTCTLVNLKHSDLRGSGSIRVRSGKQENDLQEASSCHTGNPQPHLEPVHEQWRNCSESQERRGMEVTPLPGGLGLWECLRQLRNAVSSGELKVPANSGWSKDNGMSHSRLVRPRIIGSLLTWMFYQHHKVLIQVTCLSSHWLFGSPLNPKWPFRERLAESMLHRDLHCPWSGKNLKCIDISLAKRLQIGRLPRVVVSKALLWELLRALAKDLCLYPWLPLAAMRSKLPSEQQDEAGGRTPWGHWFPHHYGQGSC